MTKVTAALVTNPGLVASKPSPANCRQHYHQLLVANNEDHSIGLCTKEKTYDTHVLALSLHCNLTEAQKGENGRALHARC